MKVVGGLPPEARHQQVVNLAHEGACANLLARLTSLIEACGLTYSGLSAPNPRDRSGPSDQYAADKTVSPPTSTVARNIEPAI